MKLKSTLVHLLTGLALATTGWGDVVGVDAIGTTTSAGLLDPAIRTWKQLGTSFPLAGMTVNTSLSSGFNGGIGAHAPLSIFDKYKHNGGSGTMTVTITGLNDAHSYKLAVIMAQDFVGGRGGKATVTTAGATNPPAKSSSVGTNFSTFVDLDNCVVFEGLRTGTTPGQITFTVENGPDGIGIFNGFEIENVDPIPPGIRGPASVAGISHGETIPLTVKVRNTGAVDYHVTGTSYSGANGAEFSDIEAKPLVVPASGSVDMIVDFTPTAGGQRHASLELTTDDPSASSVSVPLTVQVNDPSISLGANLAFGTFVSVPGAVTATLDVDNSGTSFPLTVGSPLITGSGAAAFSVTSLPGSIAAGDVDELKVTFNPPAAGVYAAQLSLATNDPIKPTVTVNLSGQVIGGGVPKMKWGFDYTSGTVASQGGTVADDSGNANPGLLLAPGHGDGGNYSADIPVAGAAIGQAKDVTGTGSLNLTGAVGLCTGSGAFTGQALNGLSAAAIEAAGGITYEIWVKNISGTGQYGAVMTLAGMHSIRYNPADGLAFAYGDGSSAPISYGLMDTPEWTHLAAVMVATPGTGAKSYSRIMIYVNGVKVGEHANGHTFPWFLERGASVGMHPVLGGDNVSGMIYEPRLTAGTLTPQEFTVVAPPAGIFAPASVKGTNQGDLDELTITVENTSSTGRTLTTPTLSGPHAAFFSVSTFPSSLDAASSGQIVVDFDSVASGGGTFTATLTIHSDDPARPSYEVPLIVEVHDPSIIAPANLQFGQLTGPGVATGTVDIDNSGINVALVLSNPQITGAGAAAYSVSSVPESIAAGARGQVGVSFNLSAVGSFPAQLTFDTNDPFKPTISFNLTGEVTSINDTVKVTSVRMVSASRLRIEFEGVASTSYVVKSSDDLISAFTGSVTPAVDGLTTTNAGGGRGVGYVEIDVATPGRKFFRIQSP